MKKIYRFLRHLLNGPWSVKCYFSAAAMHNIEAAIRQSESRHSGQIRFVVEAALHPLHLMQSKTPRQRAIELFANLGIWDTEHNSGVLVYLMLADRTVEVVADRGVNGHVGTQGWELICHDMQAAFRRGEFEAGVLTGITKISEVLQTHFPPNGENSNELPDKPLVL